jgi:hypothetical protein
MPGRNAWIPTILDFFRRLADRRPTIGDGAGRSAVGSITTPQEGKLARPKTELYHLSGEPNHNDQ